MTAVIRNAFNKVSEFFSSFGNQNQNQPQRGGGRGHVNGGIHPQQVGIGSESRRLYSVQGGNSVKRPYERLIPIQQIDELTDDEDELPGTSSHYNLTNLAKRFKSSGPPFPPTNVFEFGHSSSYSEEMERERIITRGSGIRPDIPGVRTQPWQFNFPSPKRRTTASKQSDLEASHEDNQIMHTMEPPPTSLSNFARGNNLRAASQSQTKTEYSNFRFVPRPKEIEVITILDDAPANNTKPSVFSQAVNCCRRKSENVIQNKPIMKQRQNVTFMSALSSVGKRAVNPISSSVDLEEKNKYKELIQKMSTKCHPITSTFSFAGRHLHRSKIDQSEARALFNNWNDGSRSPKVTLAIPYKTTSNQSLQERLNQDLGLFHTPAASRSSGSTPGPTSPRIVVDLEEECKDKTLRQYLSVAKKPHAELSHSASFADLNDALSSTKYDDVDVDNVSLTEKYHGDLLSQDQEKDNEDDNEITILSESILNRSGKPRLNSLALEQNLSPYVNRAWLTDISSSARDNKNRIDKQIQEHLAIVDVLNTESTLERDLREDIRRKLMLTEIIVLEEPPPTLPDITQDMLMVIDSAKRPGRDSDVLAVVFNIDITRGDIKTLAPCKWLNDNVINSYMELICQRSTLEKDLPKVHAFTTFFYPKLLKEGYSNPLRRWTRKVDIFDNDLLMFPIHLGLHWCLACADLRSKTISYHDSLGGKNDKCLHTLLKYLVQEMKERKDQILNKDEWVLENVEDVPQQQNGSDCGVFTCKFAEYLSRDVKLTFTQENMNYYRERMIYEIIQKDLLYP